MRDGTPTGRVGLTALNVLQDVQVIQHVLHAAVVRQSIEKRSDHVLYLHRPPFNSSLSQAMKVFILAHDNPFAPA